MRLEATHVGGRGTVHPESSGFDAYIPVCRVALRTIDVCLVIMKATYAFFAALRMLALYGMSKPVFATIFALGLLGPGVQILILPFEDPSPQALVPVPSSANLFGPINCFRARTSQVETSPAFGEVMNMIIPILRAYFFTFEAILIALTTRKILVQRCLRSPIIRTPFITVICCKGTLYFLITEAVTTINLVGIILSLTDPGGPADVVTFLCLTGTLVEAITSICMSRFILDLLAITLDENSDGIRTSQWRTLSFATVVENIADDLGGDLCDSSTADRGEESVVIHRIPV